MGKFLEWCQTEGGGATGNVQWGPSFGQSAGDDPTSFNVQAALDLQSIDLVGSTAVTATIALSNLDIGYALGLNAAVDLPSINLTGNLGVNSTLDKDISINQAPQEDTWLDGDNVNDTHGGDDTLIARTAPALGDERFAYIAWDLTGVSGTISSATIEITALTTAAVGESSDVLVYTNATKPFEEDTADWANDEPPPGTLRQTISVSWNTSYTREILTLDSTTRSNMAGNWIYIKIQGAGVLGISSINVRSKEFSTATDRPELIYIID